MKRCPKCAEKIQTAATVCRYCGAEQASRARESNKALYAVSAGVLLVCLIASKFTKDEPPQIKAVEASEPKDPYGGCLLRGLDNQPRNFAGMVKQRLRNPDSFQHVRTSPGRIENGTFSVEMTYRATNGFGAVDTAVARGEVRVADCGARVTAME